MIVSKTKYSALEGRIDAKFYETEFLELAEWLNSVETFKISELCAQSKLRAAIINKPDEVFKYIEVENVDPRTGYVTYQNIVGHDAPSRAKKVVKESDVIVSMVRPDKGTVGIISQELDGCICSTGFCVLVPKQIDAVSLFCLLKSSITRRQLIRSTACSMYPTISESDVLSVKIPKSVLQSSAFEENCKLVKEAMTQQRVASEKMLKTFCQLEITYGRLTKDSLNDRIDSKLPQ